MYSEKENWNGARSDLWVCGRNMCVAAGGCRKISSVNKQESGGGEEVFGHESILICVCTSRLRDSPHVRLAALAIYGNSPRLNHFLISPAFTTGLDWRLGALQTHCFIKPHWPLKQQESFYRHTCTVWWCFINGSYEKWTNLIKKNDILHKRGQPQQPKILDWVVANWFLCHLKPWIRHRCCCHLDLSWIRWDTF